MKKEHKVLKFFMPLLACIYGLALSLLCASVMMGEEISLYQSLLSRILEVVAILITLLLIKKVIPKVFPEVKNYKIAVPKAYILIAIFLTVPLWEIVKYHLICIVASSASTVDLQPVVYTFQELKEDLVASISAIFLAPVYEELSYRFLALAPFKKRSSQIIFGSLVALFFGILHLGNFFGAFVDAIIYMLLFVITQNIVLSIWAHCCMNLFVTIIIIMSYCGIWNVVHSSYPTIVLIENPSTTVMASILATIGVVVFIVGYKRCPKNKEK